MEIFIERLNDLLEEKRISKYRFAKDIGVSRQTVVRWCGGLTKPKSSHIIKFAKYFGVTADFLLGLDEETDFKKK